MKFELSHFVLLKKTVKTVKTGTVKKDNNNNNAKS